MIQLHVRTCCTHSPWEEGKNRFKLHFHCEGGIMIVILCLRLLAIFVLGKGDKNAWSYTMMSAVLVHISITNKMVSMKLFFFEGCYLLWQKVNIYCMSVHPYLGLRETFQRERTTSLLPHWPNDCAVPLLPCAAPLKHLLYSLSPPWPDHGKIYQWYFQGWDNLK